MKTKISLLWIALSILFFSCKYDYKYEYPTQVGNADLSSVEEFYAQNGVQMQTYTINGSTGGSFTSPQGTLVTVPPNTFVTQANVPVTADVTIQFKDIFKKSDILLSNMHTMDWQGAPLKSGGEFFLKAMLDNTPVNLKYGKKIILKIDAALTGGVDTANAQTAYVFLPQDSGRVNNLWWPNNYDTVETQAEYYMYNLYQFSYPLESGTWLNCDNRSFFGKYTQTLLTLQPKDAFILYNTQVFLVFNDVNAVLPIGNIETQYTYNYAPVGLQCTVVAFGVLNKTLYASFVPITITPNQTVDFKLNQTTTAEFKAKLDLLN